MKGQESGLSAPDSRRGFLNLVIRGSAAIIGAATVIPGIGLLLAPVFSAASRVKRRVVFKTPTDRNSESFVAARYEGQEETAPGIFVRNEGGKPVALSARCTHASCAVSWSAGDRQFVCPCHGGRYDAEGRVVTGPPPKPLERLTTSIEGGDVFIEEPEA